MMTKCIWFSVLTVVVYQQMVMGARGSAGNDHSEMDRAIAFVIVQEVLANRFENRKDVCIGFGHELGANENAIMAELRSRGLKLRPSEWCNQGPRGSIVSIIAPVGIPRAHVYEIAVELGDLQRIKKEGEHFGTLIRRGTYTVQVSESTGPELLAYRKNCCPE